MDTRTGEIIAAADYPTYNANEPAEAAEEDLGSRAASDVYEPGSVEKVLTFGALIDAGKITPRTRLQVPEKLTRNGATIGDHWDHGDIRRSEEHTSELRSLMRISYAVFCLKQKKHSRTHAT